MVIKSIINEPKITMALKNKLYQKKLNTSSKNKGSFSSLCTLFLMLLGPFRLTCPLQSPTPTVIKCLHKFNLQPSSIVMEKNSQSSRAKAVFGSPQVRALIFSVLFMKMISAVLDEGRRGRKLMLRGCRICCIVVIRQWSQPSCRIDGLSESPEGHNWYLLVVMIK